MLDKITALATAALGLLAAWLRIKSGPTSRRPAIKDDLAILRELDVGSEAHAVLADHVAKRVVQLVERERLTRRDWNGIAGGVFWLAFAATAFVFAHRGHWWTYLYAVVVTSAIIGVVAIAISVRRTFRDAKGNAVTAPAVSEPESGTTPPDAGELTG